MERVEGLEELHNISYKILEYIDKICKENDIQYFLAYGTALGAVRHKGFIPWDDDTDIMMTRENYNKFIKIMDNIVDKNYKCLHEGKNFPNYFYRFAKVVDLNTSVTEENYINNPDLGVWVDVFPIDTIDENKGAKILKKYINLGILQKLAAKKSFEPSKHGKLRTICKYLTYIYAKLRGWKHWNKKSKKLIEKYNDENYDYVAIYDGEGEKDIMHKSLYSESVLMQFGQQEYPIVKDYHYYLSKIYGDYMTPPPIHERPTHGIDVYKKDK